MSETEMMLLLREREGWTDRQTECVCVLAKTYPDTLQETVNDNMILPELEFTLIS